MPSKNPSFWVILYLATYRRHLLLEPTDVTRIPVISRPIQSLSHLSVSEEGVWPCKRVKANIRTE